MATTNADKSAKPGDFVYGPEKSQPVDLENFARKCLLGRAQTWLSSDVAEQRATM
jgi:hypothetical protein